jgi:hypothetical protein
MDKLSLTDNPNFKEVHALFNEVNGNLQAANIAHRIENIRVSEFQHRVTKQCINRGKCTCKTGDLE